VTICDAGFHRFYDRLIYDVTIHHWNGAKIHSSDAKIRRLNGGKRSGHRSCGGCSSSFCPKICGRCCCGRLHRADVSCLRSCDPMRRILSAFYRLVNDWTFWLQPLQSSVLGEFAYNA
jgi:hypothetical protein